jgi:formylglycine-generating enzyme required for sulfatase activity
MLLWVLVFAPSLSINAQSTQPQQAPNYDALIAAGKKALKEGQFKDAGLASLAAIKADGKRYEGFALGALTHEKMGSYSNAVEYAKTALELAPESKRPGLEALKAELMEKLNELTLEPNVRLKAVDAAVALNREEQRKWQALQLIYEEAGNAANRGEQVRLLWECLSKSADFAKAHPSHGSVWVMRAVASADLDYAQGGWRAGQELKRLKLDTSDDPEIVTAFLRLERKGWLDGVEPVVDWSRSTLEQVRDRAGRGDLDATYALGRWHENGEAGLAKDRGEALKWYRKAAAGGDQRAERAVAALEQADRDKFEEERVWWTRLGLAARPEPGMQKRFAKKPEIGVVVRWIPAGGFDMGSAPAETGRADYETQHKVTLSEGFWMAETETTQALWRSVMQSNPSYFKGDKLPVERVSWDDALQFCRRLTERQRGQGLLDDAHEWRLPTEAQWEYACRAGTTGAYHGAPGEVGWCSDNSGQKTHAVGGKTANAWGLKDMHGNVWEWCADWYGDYPTGVSIDPQGPQSGGGRVHRGGGWNVPGRYCRSAYRGRSTPGNQDDDLGFRVVLVRVP